MKDERVGYRVEENGYLYARKKGRKEKRAVGSCVRLLQEGWMKGWMDGWMDGWMGE